MPEPNPIKERQKKLQVYDPTVHKYDMDAPEFVEIEPGHFVLANKEEQAQYRKLIERQEANA